MSEAFKVVEKTIVKTEGNYTRPSHSSPHSIVTRNTILHEFVENLFETIGNLETSDIMIRLCKNPMTGAFWLLARIPTQNEWAIIMPEYYLDYQLQQFWGLVIDIKQGKRLIIYDNDQ